MKATNKSPETVTDLPTYTMPNGDKIYFSRTGRTITWEYDAWNNPQFMTVKINREEMEKIIPTIPYTHSKSKYWQDYWCRCKRKLND